MKKTYPALCRDCKYSEPEPSAQWNLKCMHPVVNAKDPYALAYGGSMRGSACISERQKSSFLAVCGIKGKKWEPVAAAEGDA